METNYTPPDPVKAVYDKQTAAELKVVQAKIDAEVLKVIEKGKHFTRDILQHLEQFDSRPINNALRRLKAAGKAHFTGAKADQGWRVGPARMAPHAVTPDAKKASRKPRKASRNSKAARKTAIARSAAKKKKKPASARSGRSNVHCFLPTKLVNHVKRRLKQGETFTDAVQNGLTKKYGSP